MTTTTTPQLALTRIFDAPRALVYQAFTDPDHLAAWWGPIGCSLPRDEIECDVRPGGHQRWTMVVADEPHIRIHHHTDLTQVVDGELLDGILRVTGQLPEGFEPFEMRIRFEFYDEADGRTRLELRHWLPEHLVAMGRVGQIPTEDWISRSEQGALESFTKLDATLAA
jgi:uncharacterized protein YndB with AHSA1/START domain